MITRIYDQIATMCIIGLCAVAILRELLRLIERRQGG